ncbi:nucleotide-binding domain containing protein [Brucella pinnipedialis]
MGPQIAPGVPWVRGIGKPLSLALKSGNFGTEAFFFEAQKIANQEGDK